MSNPMKEKDPAAGAQAVTPEQQAAEAAKKRLEQAEEKVSQSPEEQVFFRRVVRLQDPSLRGMPVGFKALEEKVEQDKQLGLIRKVYETAGLSVAGLSQEEEQALGNYSHLVFDGDQLKEKQNGIIQKDKQKIEVEQKAATDAINTRQDLSVQQKSEEIEKTTKEFEQKKISADEAYWQAMVSVVQEEAKKEEKKRLEDLGLQDVDINDSNKLQTVQARIHAAAGATPGGVQQGISRQNNMTQIRVYNKNGDVKSIIYENWEVATQNDKGFGLEVHGRFNTRKLARHAINAYITSQGFPPTEASASYYGLSMVIEVAANLQVLGYPVDLEKFRYDGETLKDRPDLVALRANTIYHETWEKLNNPSDPLYAQTMQSIEWERTLQKDKPQQSIIDPARMNALKGKTLEGALGQDKEAVSVLMQRALNIQLVEQQAEQKRRALIHSQNTIKRAPENIKKWENGTWGRFSGKNLEEEQSKLILKAYMAGEQTIQKAPALKSPDNNIPLMAPAGAASLSDTSINVADYVNALRAREKNGEKLTGEDKNLLEALKTVDDEKAAKAMIHEAKEGIEKALTDPKNPANAPKLDPKDEQFLQQYKQMEMQRIFEARSKLKGQPGTPPVADVMDYKKVSPARGYR